MAWVWIIICLLFFVVGIRAIHKKKEMVFQIVGWIFTVLAAVIIVINIPHLNITKDSNTRVNNVLNDSVEEEVVFPSDNNSITSSSAPVYVDDKETPIGTTQVIIAENIVIEESKSYYDEESRFTFSPNTIYSSFISATITLHGESSQQCVMHSGDTIDYSYDSREFSFCLFIIDDANHTCTITIREYIPCY